MARLGDICTIQSGGTPSRHNKAYWDDGTIPWVKISDIKDKYLDATEERITKLGLENSSAKIFPAGTILYTIFATLGEVCILNIEAATNQAISGIQLESKQVDKDYLYHYLSSLKSTVNNIGRGVAQNNINMTILRNFEIPLPPLEEQRKIAAVLDKISDLIAKRRTQLDKLDELVKSRFIEMFGDVTKNEKNWSTRKISEIATLQSGGTPSRQFPKYFEGTIPWITTVALGKNAIGIEDAIEYITEEAIENSATKLIPKNSLLFGIRVGVGKVSENIVPMCINQDIVAIIINDRYKLNMLFLKNLLDMFSGYFNSQKRGATIQGIKSEVLKNISVSLPPIELQNQFAAFVKQTDKSKLAIQKNLEKLEILRKSLMQKYFD